MSITSTLQVNSHPLPLILPRFRRRNKVQRHLANHATTGIAPTVVYITISMALIAHDLMSVTSASRRTTSHLIVPPNDRQFDLLPIEAPFGFSFPPASSLQRIPSDVPDVPHFPGILDVPGAPGVPHLSGVPDVPHLPGVPDVHHLSGVPNILTSLASLTSLAPLASLTSLESLTSSPPWRP